VDAIVTSLTWACDKFVSSNPLNTSNFVFLFRSILPSSLLFIKYKMNLNPLLFIKTKEIERQVTKVILKIGSF